MSPLRRRLIEDMQIRNLAPSTQRAYVAQLVHFACYFRKSPDLLGPAEIRAYLIYLAQEKRLAASSIIVTVSALRFFYTVTLRRPWVIDQDIPTVRRGKKLPVVLSQDEVARFLAAVDNLKHRMVLTVCYATGLRISEAVRLTPAAIDSKRIVIRVEQGIGRQRPLCDVIPETSRYAEELLGQDPSRGMALSRSMARRTDRSIQHRCHLPGGQTTVRHRQTGHAAFAAPRLRRSPSRGRHQPTYHPAAARSSQSRHHGPVSHDRHRQGVRHGQSFGHTRRHYANRAGPRARLTSGFRGPRGAGGGGCVPPLRSGFP